MLFVITKTEPDKSTLGESPLAITRFHWTLYKVAKGEVVRAVAKSVEFFASEADARSDIALAKKAFSGSAARFAKVRVDS